MKQIILFLAIVAQLGIGQLAAQDYEYVPFVREGVKWVYYYDSPFETIADEFIPQGRHYYSLELKGDTIIDGHHYKPMHLYSGNSINEETDTVPVYLREENKVVYALMLNDKMYAECPVGIGGIVTYNNIVTPIIPGQEYALYDFNDAPEVFYDGLGYCTTDTVMIAGQPRKRHVFNNPDGQSYIIEGIGYAGGDQPGSTLYYFYNLITGLQVIYNLSYVEENGLVVFNDGQLVGIDEVAADRAVRPADDNYYNLMGQPKGTEVPTVPGIYIHQGRKIVVR